MKFCLEKLKTWEGQYINASGIQHFNPGIYDRYTPIIDTWIVQVIIIVLHNVV